MSFWTEASIEPKRNFRFKVEITGFDDNSVIWWVKNFKTHLMMSARHLTTLWITSITFLVV